MLAQVAGCPIAVFVRLKMSGTIRFRCPSEDAFWERAVGQTVDAFGSSRLL